MQGKNKTTLGQWTCQLVHTALSLHHRPSGAGQGYPGPTLAVPDPGPFETQAALSGLCPMRRGPGSDASPLQGPYRCPGHSVLTLRREQESLWQLQ